MDVDCEGCAGCCIDWRPLADEALDHEHRGRYAPLDDAYNLAPLTREEVRAFVESGLGDVLQPRLFSAADGAGDGEAADRRRVTVDGVDVAAVAGRPVFFVGLRKPPKPVGPFGRESTWLRTCAFLDPTTLQCRLHDDDRYPETCASYPGENLRLGVETECERVERVHGGERLRDDEPPEATAPLLGPDALGTKVFAHPAPGRLESVVERLRGGEARREASRKGERGTERPASPVTAEDRAELVAVAAASSPATLAVSDDHYERAREAVLAADSWAGRAIRTWEERAGSLGDAAPDPAVARRVEDDEGAPGTPGWEAIRAAENGTVDEAGGSAAETDG